MKVVVSVPYVAFVGAEDHLVESTTSAVPAEQTSDADLDDIPAAVQQRQSECLAEVLTSVSSELASFPAATSCLAVAYLDGVACLVSVEAVVRCTTHQGQSWAAAHSSGFVEASRTSSSPAAAAAIVVEVGDMPSSDERPPLTDDGPNSRKPEYTVAAASRPNQCYRQTFSVRSRRRRAAER